MIESTKIENLRRILLNTFIQPRYTTYNFVDMLLIAYLAGKKGAPVTLFLNSTPGENKTRMIHLFAKAIGAKICSVLIHKETRRRDILPETIYEVQLSENRKMISSEIREDNDLLNAEILYLDESLNAPAPLWDLLRDIRNTGEIDLNYAQKYQTPIRLVVESNNLGLYFDVNSLIRQLLEIGLNETIEHFETIFERRFSESIDETIEIRDIDISEIRVPRMVKKCIWEIISIIESKAKSRIVSTRRVSRIKRLLQASAYVNGREVVNYDDLYLLLNIFEMFKDHLEENWKSAVLETIDNYRVNGDLLENFARDPWNNYQDLTEEDAINIITGKETTVQQLAALAKRFQNDEDTLKIITDALKEKLQFKVELDFGADDEIEYELDSELEKCLRAMQRFSLERSLPHGEIEFKVYQERVNSVSDDDGRLHTYLIINVAPEIKTMKNVSSKKDFDELLNELKEVFWYEAVNTKQDTETD